MSATLPNRLIESLEQLEGFEKTSFLTIHQSGNPVNSIRLNPYKPSKIFAEDIQIPWCNTGRYLEKRPSFTADPLFHAGCYYVQEASSMFLEQAIGQTCDLNRNLRVLDLCAAPGGKSTHLLSLLSGESLLISNEVIKNRTGILAANIAKWGNSNSIVTSNDPADFDRLKGYFDVIVIDAPCSGSGMFRKDPAAINEWSEEAVQLCSMRQKRILASIYPALKENGILIYSTCSYSKEENEDIADWLTAETGAETIRLTLTGSWGIEETQSERNACYSYRFYPDKLKGEGFFISCFRKTEPANGKPRHIKKSPPADKKIREAIQPHLAETEAYTFLPVSDQYIAIQKTHEEDLQLLRNSLYIKKAGIRLGKIAGKELLPDHELAVSTIAGRRFHRTELTQEEAIKYLRKDEMLPSGSGHTGWTLMCYEGFSLGWAKILPNRINNYFPKELRILKEI
jgi:16S rRNA C967 or C1407 C5-methylase (RsmB/RsmF family)/NOL1/NOP2/fmu family ribosome biogenesis protein